MSLEAQTSPPTHDAVSNVLKWILLATAIICFALFFWATAVTYERAPPEPDRFVGPDGATVMTAIIRLRQMTGTDSSSRAAGVSPISMPGLL